MCIFHTLLEKCKNNVQLVKLYILFLKDTLVIFRERRKRERNINGRVAYWPASHFCGSSPHPSTYPDQQPNQQSCAAGDGAEAVSHTGSGGTFNLHHSLVISVKLNIYLPKNSDYGLNF